MAGPILGPGPAGPKFNLELEAPATLRPAGPETGLEARHNLAPGECSEPGVKMVLCDVQALEGRHISIDD